MNDEKLVSSGWATKSYASNLWTRYKINLDGFNRLWSDQNERCAGCLNELAHPTQHIVKFGLKPEVDHDHLTGKVRGLLCRRCNDFLGKIKDNHETLQRLVDYLRRAGDLP